MKFYDIYQSALFTQATYAQDLLDNQAGQDLVDFLTKKDPGMSQAQAEYFASKYKAVVQQENTTTGFAATVFEELDTGKLHFSMRGSEFSNFVSDWVIADVFGIGEFGAATGQIMDRRK